MTRTRTALLLTLALATTPALAQQDVSKVNGSVSADAGQGGRVIFDGPLANPSLDIVALRRNLAVEAGVEIDLHRAGAAHHRPTHAIAGVQLGLESVEVELHRVVAGGAELTLGGPDRVDRRVEDAET